MNMDLLISIKSFNAGREQSVLLLKYKVMAKSPFRFFRGTCHLFYEDLVKEYPFPQSPLTWICGDLHIENFGSYRGNNGLVYFDMNDFDEAIQAPLLYEMARLLVSVEVAAAEIRFSKKEKKIFIQQLLHHYRQILISGKSKNIEKETATGLIKKLINKVDKRKEKALLIKRTTNKSKDAQLLLNDRLLQLPKNKKKDLAKVFTEWFKQNYHKDYKVTDAGFRIAGTGSIGVKRYCCLLENEKNPQQKKLIDIKKALPPSILNYINLKQPAWENEAQRVIKVQEMMQHVAPAYLSAFQYQDDWYVVKDLQPTADKVNIEQAVKQPNDAEKYIADLGILTAAAQLRSSGRYNSATADELKQFAKDESWVTALTAWSLQYAAQIKIDYKEFYTAWKDGYFKT